MFNQREAKQVAWYTPPLSRMAPWTDHGRSENGYPGDPLLDLGPPFLSFLFQGQRVIYTPPKFNMEPENHMFEKESHLPSTTFFWVQNVYFQRS